MLLFAVEGNPADQGITATPLALFLIQVMLIIILSRALGFVLKRTLHEPLVIAEIIAGILLGPTALGHIPGWTAYLFPPSSLPILSVFANVGLIFFMFLIGLELDPRLLRTEGRRGIIIAAVCVIFPFALGAILSIYLYNNEPPGVKPSFISFVLFVGVAMSITAFPVLARIIADARLLSSPLGTVTMAAAAINDVIGWLILAFALSIASASAPLRALYTVLETLGFVVGMVFLVRPLLMYSSKYIDTETVSQPVVVATFLMLFFSAWATEAIGIHALFGAFVMGAIFPKKDMTLASSIVHIIEDITVVFLMPLYFVKSGLKTDLGVLDNADAWKSAALVIVCATGGKVLGGLLSSRLTGLNWRESFSLGVLMNTRGLVELIVLNLGLELKVISSQLFAALVLMALVTTFATAPILRLLYTREMVDRISKEKMLVVKDATFSLLLFVSSERIGGMMTLATALCNPFRGRFALTVLHLTPISNRPSAYMAEMHRESAPGDAIDRTIKERLREHGLTKRADLVSYATSDEKHEVESVATAKGAHLVILPLHRTPTDRYSIQGGDIARHLHHAQRNTKVAVFIDKGLGLNLTRILYGFSGPPSAMLGTHAAKLARLVSRSPGCDVNVLQVVPLEYITPLETDQTAVWKKISRRFHLIRAVVSDCDPTPAMISEARKGYDLLIVGMVPLKRESFLLNTSLTKRTMSSHRIATSPTTSSSHHEALNNRGGGENIPSSSSSPPTRPLPLPFPTEHSISSPPIEVTISISQPPPTSLTTNFEFNLSALVESCTVSVLLVHNDDASEDEETQQHHDQSPRLSLPPQPSTSSSSEFTPRTIEDFSPRSPDGLSLPSTRAPSPVTQVDDESPSVLRGSNSPVVIRGSTSRDCNDNNSPIVIRGSTSSDVNDSPMVIRGSASREGFAIDDKGARFSGVSELEFR